MAIPNISSLPISASFQQILQISGSVIGTATGSQIDNLDISASYASKAGTADNATTATTATTAVSASHAVNADTASFALNVPTVDTGSLLTTASISDATITFEKGDASTFAITVDNVDTASTAISSSHALQADSALAADTATSASHAVQADSALNADTATSASHAVKADLAHNANDLIVGVKNTSGSPITKGQVLHATGVTGENINVELADNTAAANMPGFAIANEAISTNATGQAIVSGRIIGINTAGLTAGNNVYVNASGGFTGTKPTGSALIQNIGVVGKVDASDGELVVLGSGRSNDLPNIAEDHLWVGNSDGVATATDKDALTVGTASLALGVATGINLNVNTITASSAVFQSASVGYLESITGSAKIIGDAFVVVNNDTPAERYAGLAVYDSGSANNTSSFAYDGLTDDWFFEKDVTGSAHFGVALFGPEYATKGAPTYITQNRVPKGVGDHHLEDSNISDNGSKIVLGSDSEITGSLGVTGTITGTLSGQASTAISASHAIQADNASTAISASHALQADNATTADTAISASHALIADSSLIANTASYIAGANVDGLVVSASYAISASHADNVPAGIITNNTDTYTTPDVNNIITLTAAEYAAIVTPDSNTFYIVI